MNLQTKDMLCQILYGMGEQFAYRTEFVLAFVDEHGVQRVSEVIHPGMSGFHVGDALVQTELQLKPGKQDDGGCYNALVQTGDGRILRTSTIVLRGEDGTAQGTVLVYYDVTELSMLRRLVDETLGFENENAEKPCLSEQENVEDLLAEMIRDSIQRVGMPVARMTREQKVEGIGYLYHRGAFRIKNAGGVIAQYYDISRYTIYNYLNDHTHRAVIEP